MDEPLPPNPYLALGLSKDVDSAAIKSAYRKLALKFHPDKCIDDALKEVNTATFHKIQKAYDLIGEENERKRYDALVKLHELREEKIKLAAGRSSGRPPMRSYSGYSAPAATAPSARSYTFEERTPKFSDIAEEAMRSSRRPAAQPVRVERFERDDKRRSERPRDRDRDSKSRAYDFADDRHSSGRSRDYDDAYDRLRRKEEHTIPTTERKYSSLEEEAVRYQSSESLPRPGSYTRRSSTRDDPPYEPRRSRASPRDRERDIDERAREFTEKDREIASMLKEKLRLRREARLDREREEKRDQDRRERSRDRARQRTRDRDERTRAPKLYSSNSEPPQLPGDISRASTYSAPPKPDLPPMFERSATMPANSSAKREINTEPKLKIPLGDSGYSSSSQAEDIYREKKSKSGKKATVYAYNVTPSYKTEIREPEDGNSSRERISSRRPSYDRSEAIRPSMPHSMSTSSALPERRRRERSDRDHGRERDRRHSPDRYREEKLYGEMRPAPSHSSRNYSYRDENVQRAKRYTHDDVQYSPGFHRQSSMPVGAS